MQECVYGGICVGGGIANETSDNFAPDFYRAEDFVVCPVLGDNVVFCVALLEFQRD